MLPVSPVPVIRVAAIRSRRGPLHRDVARSEVVRVLTRFDVDLAWTDVLLTMSHAASGHRPDAAWLDGGDVPSEDRWTDRLPMNFCRGMFGLRPEEFAANRVTGTAADIYAPHASIAAALVVLSTRHGPDPAKCAETVGEWGRVSPIRSELQVLV